MMSDDSSDWIGIHRDQVYLLFDANFNISSLVWDADPNTEGFQAGVLERYRYEPYGDRVVLNADFTPDTLADQKADRSNSVIDR
jgi:hypothetical protein